ncbi:MAG: phenylalanine--tRNA ligase subunit beta [bacterium]
MKISLDWLNELIGKKLTETQAGELLSQAGLPLESVNRLDQGFTNVVVAEIVEINPHPNADKLRLATVKTSPTNTQQVVCGAPNIKVGQKAPLAQVGSRLATGLTLKKASIRGVESNGMLCAEDELGLGAGHEGIVVLDPGAKIGQPLSEALNLSDVGLEIEITPNRADAQSAVGLARDISVLLGKKFISPKYVIKDTGATKVKVTIKDKKACPKYSARLVTGLKTELSPAWMQTRLLASGMRPVNLIVDVSNYVMLELGQPLHAFDAGKVADQSIIVRRANKGERLKTLDNQVRELTADMLVIADAKGPIALAGVMGGADSEVSDKTREVILESAVFDPKVVRKTARSLHLLSEASMRFERGVDRDMTETALDRATELLVKHGKGKLAGKKTVVKSASPKTPTISLSLEKLSKTLNNKFAATFVKKILINLGCQVTGSAKALKVRPPSWRADLQIEQDLQEEVTRVYGYHNLKPTRLSGEFRPAPITDLEKIVSQTKDAMARLDYDEVSLYSYEYPAGKNSPVYSSLNLPKPLVIQNPLDPKHNILRRSLLINLEIAAKANLERSPISAFLAFEVGSVFFKDGKGVLPNEQIYCGGTVWLLSKKKNWLGSTIKGHISHLLLELNLPEPHWHNNEIRIKEKTVGFWNVSQSTLMGKNNYTVESWEISLTKLAEFSSKKLYSGTPNQPVVKRDVALWVPESMNYNHLKEEILLQSSLIRNVELFDVFTKDGRLSIAVHLVFQAKDRTLKAQEVDQALQKIINHLDKLQVKVRR